MTRRAFFLLLVFALLGLAASSSSSWVHYQLLQDPNYTSFCDVNATVSCTEAYLSPYGSLFGTPVAIFGALWFLAVLALIVAGRPGTDLSENVPAYVFGLSTIGLAMVLYLAYAAFFELRAVCLLCVTTYIAVIGLFVVSAMHMDVPLTSLPDRLRDDLQRATGSVTTLAVIVLLLVLAGSAIAFFPKEVPANAAQPAPLQQFTAEQLAQVGQWYDSQPRKIVPVADAAGASVVIVKFNDYQCPACRDTYFNYKPVFEKYQKEAAGKVRLVIKNFPLDPECNVNTPSGPHRLACEAAAAVILARQHGNGEKLEDWLFANQATLTAENLKTATKDVGGVPDFDTKYSEVLAPIREDIELGRQLDISGTPTFYINGVLVQSVQPEIMDAIIAHALKSAAPQNPS
jgi:uncharacterized membrane protein/protein-disulfide isomerase